MRTLDPILKDALATQQGDIILRVLTWTDQADYIANPTTPDHTWETKKFFIGATSADAELITANDYTLSAFTVFIIERGVKLAGVEYTVQSGLFFVKTYQEDYGKIKLHGSSYPNLKISIAAGDGTYQEVIEAFCTAIGKTAVFKNAGDTWLAYQFLPTGKSLSLNKAELFENLLRQKYTILVYEKSPGNLVFYNQDSSLIFPNATASTGIAWSPLLNLFVVVFQTGDYRVFTSPDGINWTARTAATQEQWQAVAWSPELAIFCAVSYDGGIATSPDGINWTSRTAPTLESWTSISWSPYLNLFLITRETAGGAAGATSPDGINWTARTMNITEDYGNANIWSPELNLFCVIQLAGANAIQTSPDGINWTQRATAQNNAWQSVAWSPELNLFCAVSRNGVNRVQTSPDGITWTARTAAEQNSWVRIVWAASLGIFCAISSDGTHRVQTSPDGINWTARTAAEQNPWNTLAWSPELSLFCCTSSTGTHRVQTSPDGINWTSVSAVVDFDLTYEDGPTSHIIRDQSAVHYLWRDQNATLHTLYDTTLPQWNLGFLLSTATAPVTHEDAYYKIFLQKAPVRLDITDGDRIHFSPYWSIDPTKTIDAMMQVTEHLDLTQSPAWYQEIKSIVLFDKTEGGALPSTIERVAAYTPLVSTGFDGNLSPSVNNLQAFAQAVDDLPLISANTPATIAANDFQVGDGAGAWIKKTLAQTIAILGINADAASDNLYYGRRNAGWTNLKTYFDTLYSTLASMSAANAALLVGGTKTTLHHHEYLIPLATWVDLNPMSANDKYPYASTIDRAITFVQWTQAVYVSPANDNSNYWTIKFYYRKAGTTDTNFATIDTKTATSAGINMLTTTTFSPSAITGTGYLYVQVLKTGTPANLYMACPALKVYAT